MKHKENIRPAHSTNTNELQDRLVRKTQQLVCVEQPVLRDFFGRPVSKKTEATSPIRSPHKGHKQEEEEAKFDVYYKFHEGFTNAVRRNVYVKDFL